MEKEILGGLVSRKAREEGLVVSNAPGMTNGLVNRPFGKYEIIHIIYDKNIWETLGMTGMTG